MISNTKPSSKRTATSAFLGLAAAFMVSCAAPEEHTLGYHWSQEQIMFDSTASDHIESLIAPYRAKLDSTMNEVIGYSAGNLSSRGRYESTLGAFVVQLMHAQSVKIYNHPVDVALINHHGGLRAPIGEGPITLGEAFNVMPFENEVWLLELSGEELAELVAFIPENGTSMLWPVSFEVTAEGVENVLVGGEEIDPERTYTLVATDYQANGGNEFALLKPLKRLDVESVKLREMIIREIKEVAERGDSLQSTLPNLIVAAQ